MAIFLFLHPMRTFLFTATAAKRELIGCAGDVEAGLVVGLLLRAQTDRESE